MYVQAPRSFAGTILDVKKTHVTVVLNDNKSMLLASFIQGELAFIVVQSHGCHIMVCNIVLDHGTASLPGPAQPCSALPCPALLCLTFDPIHSHALPSLELSVLQAFLHAVVQIMARCLSSGWIGKPWKPLQSASSRCDNLAM